MFGRSLSVPPSLPPSRAVTAALAQGISGTPALAAATGLDADTVDLVLAHLEATGELTRAALGQCAATSCDGCSWAGNCAAHVPGRKVPIELHLRHPA